MRLVLLVVVACRWDFDPTTHDGATADTLPSTCAPLANGETIADCMAALASPQNAPDQVVFDCAISCMFGRCVIHDASTCTTCACVAYAYSFDICDPSGLCGAPLSGTGCIGHSYYTGAPFNCTSANGIVFEGACMVRYLEQIGACN